MPNGFAIVGPDSGRARSRRSGVVQVRFMGANPRADVSGVEPLPGRAHSFLGRDPAKWRTTVPLYGRVRLDDLYPGVDAVFYGTDGELEYDLTFAPGSDPRGVSLGFDGVKRCD
jgi:hypothetical protein